MSNQGSKSRERSERSPSPGGLPAGSTQNQNVGGISGRPARNEGPRPSRTRRSNSSPPSPVDSRRGSRNRSRRSRSRSNRHRRARSARNNIDGDPFSPLDDENFVSPNDDSAMAREMLDLRRRQEQASIRQEEQNLRQAEQALKHEKAQTALLGSLQSFVSAQSEAAKAANQATQQAAVAIQAPTVPPLNSEVTLTLGYESEGLPASSIVFSQFPSYISIQHETRVTLSQAWLFYYQSSHAEGAPTDLPILHPPVGSDKRGKSTFGSGSFMWEARLIRSKSNAKKIIFPRLAAEDRFIWGTPADRTHEATDDFLEKLYCTSQFIRFFEFFGVEADPDSAYKLAARKIPLSALGVIGKEDLDSTDGPCPWHKFSPAELLTIKSLQKNLRDYEDYCRATRSIMHDDKLHDDRMQHEKG